MEKLIAEIQAYADDCGKQPSTVVQKAAKLSGRTWKKWGDGSTCTIKVMDRIRKYMQDNPA